jgi:hypothetical protein
MDAAEVIGSKGKVCLFMQNGHGYSDAGGIRFTKDEPFQILDYMVAQRLINSGHGRFRLASKEEVAAFYGKNS